MEEGCFRVIMNMNTGRAVQLTLKLAAAPWRTRGADSSHLSRRPLPPTGLRPSTYEGCPAKTIWQLQPSAWHQIKEAVRRKCRQRKGGGERGEGWRNVPCISPGNMIWSNVWQWAVGLWNVPWLHLHLSLHYIGIFWIVWLLLMQVPSFIRLTPEEETSDNDSLH